MRHAILTGLLVALALAVLSTSAFASGWTEEVGYRFRLPEGFHPTSKTALSSGLDRMTLNLGGPGLAGDEVEMEIRAWGRDVGGQTQAVLAGVRMTFGGKLADEIGKRFDVQALRQAIEQQQDRLDAMVGSRDMSLDRVRTISLAGGQQALELVLSGQDPSQGETIVRMAMASYEDSIYLFVLQGRPAMAAQDDALWGAFTASLRLESVGGLLRFLARYWYFILGAVVLLGAFVGLVRNSRPRRVTWGSGPVVGETAAGAGFSRPLDGLPTYREHEGQGEPVPLASRSPSFDVPRTLPSSRSADPVPLAPSLPDAA
ncbi:MAG: hypothetical protein ACC662_11590, partial [Planctomycetota bacterium]